MSIGSKISPFDDSKGKVKNLDKYYEIFHQEIHQNEQVLCLTNTYKSDASTSQLSINSISPHFRFSKSLDRAVNRVVNELVPSKNRKYSNRDVNDDFIVFHIRRNDVASKCEFLGIQPTDVTSKRYAIWEARFKKSSCYVDTEEAYMVLRSWVEQDIENRAGLPILIATDEKRPEEIEKLQNPNLKWISHTLSNGKIVSHFVAFVDHEKLQTTERYVEDHNPEDGYISPAIAGYWKPMIDANLLTRGQVLIGSQPSMMTQVAVKRRRQWREKPQDISYLVPQHPKNKEIIREMQRTEP